MTAIAFQAGKVLQVAGVSQLVQIKHRLIALRQPVHDKIRADKAGTARDQNH